MSDEFSYTKYMLLHKIPIRFLQIILPEMIISFILYLLNNILRLFPSFSAYCIGFLIGLVVYWIITWILAARDSENTHTIGHYYICNISAYALFLLVAGIACYIASRKPTFPEASGYFFFPFFRLSFALTLIDDGVTLINELPLSFIFFYGITFIIIMIQPLIQLIFETAYARNITRNVEMHNDKFKEMEEALEKSEFKK